jgi:hypothetical protein
MGLKDRLLGKKPPPPEVDSAPVKRSPFETIPKAQRNVGRSLKELVGVLRGASSGHVKVCPSCNRSLDPEESHCPVGHYVG